MYKHLAECQVKVAKPGNFRCNFGELCLQNWGNLFYKKQSIISSAISYKMINKYINMDINIGIYNVIDASLKKVKTLFSNCINYDPNNKKNQLNPLIASMFFVVDQKYMYIPEFSEEKYSIKQLDNSGNTCFVINKKIKKIEYTKEEYENDKSLLNSLSNIKSDINTIKYKRLINGVFIDSTTRLWVSVSQPIKETNTKGYRFDLFSKGEYQGTINYKFPIANEFSIYLFMKIIRDKIYITDLQNSKISVYSYKK